MNRVEIQSWLPMFVPLRLLDDKFERSLTEARQSFLSQLGAALEFVRGVNIEVTQVEWASPPNEIRTLFKGSDFLVDTKFCEFLSISSIVTLDMEALYKLNNTDHFEGKYIRGFAISEMVFAITKVLTISELAYPGLISTLKGMCFAKDISGDFREKSAFIDVIDFQVSEIQWPAISIIDLSESVKWAFEVGYGSNSYAESRVGKALAAYTHIVGLRSENVGEVLFRAMQGLEAFYAEGSGNLRYQLSQKVSSWLGKWPVSKNIVGTLYDERSKYIHGSAPLEFFSELPESTKEHLKRSNAFVSSSTFASQLLIATLQKCVKDRIKNVYWEQTVRKEH